MLNVAVTATMRQTIKKKPRRFYCAIYFYLLFGSKNMAEILNILIDAWLNGLSLKQL